MYYLLKEIKAPFPFLVSELTLSDLFDGANIGIFSIILKCKWNIFYCFVIPNFSGVFNAGGGLKKAGQKYGLHGLDPFLIEKPPESKINDSGGFR